MGPETRHFFLYFSAPRGAVCGNDFTQLIKNISDTVDVEVLVEASLEFGGDFAEPGEVSILLSTSSVMVECSANGGFPEAEITASIVDENGELIRELEELSDLGNVEYAYDTHDVTRQFLLIPSLDDCGMSVKCEAVQGDEIFVTQDTRQLLIVYPPQPVALETPFQYQVWPYRSTVV